MGNTQKKLRGGKDGKKDGGKEGLKHDTSEHVEILLKKGPIEDYYEVDYNTVLGKGHYAIVNKGRDRKTGLQVAVKRIKISISRVEALKREVEVLRKVGKHPNIVTLYDIFITDTELILVLELLLGGELFDRMVKSGPYSEREASHHIRKIGQALKFLHRSGIVHRDLKPENLLLAHTGDNSELKIADFGLANIVENIESATMKTVCGTWAYCAPEVKTTITEEGGQASYNAKVDLWSLGVILFVTLAAYHPFDADGDASDAQLWTNICSGKFDFNDPAWDMISASAKNLIENLIVVDPSKRFGTDELLAHPWISQTASIPATPITPSINRSLIDFNEKRKFRSKGFVGNIRQRLNPLNINRNGQTTPPSSAPLSPLGTLPITETDLAEQKIILEEQRRAVASQQLQAKHKDEQQALSLRQEQQLASIQQQHQVLQQEIFLNGGEHNQEQQLKLTQEFQQKIQACQMQFHQEQEQLRLGQQEELDHLTSQMVATESSLAPPLVHPPPKAPTTEVPMSADSEMNEQVELPQLTLNTLLPTNKMEM